MDITSSTLELEYTSQTNQMWKHIYTGIWGFAESKLLSAQAPILSAQPLPRGSSRQRPHGTAGPAKSPLPRAKGNPPGKDVP
jgi:hypothetical protein